jgi:hypothetical protein
MPPPPPRTFPAAAGGLIRRCESALRERSEVATRERAIKDTWNSEKKRKDFAPDVISSDFRITAEGIRSISGFPGDPRDEDSQVNRRTGVLYCTSAARYAAFGVYYHVPRGTPVLYTARHSPSSPES